MIDVQSLALLFFVFLISFIFNRFIIKVSNKFGLLDTPNERSMHKNPIPRGGGIAIFVSFFIGFFLAENFFDFSLNIGTLCAIAFMVVVGVIDDIFGTSSKFKLLLIFIAANLLFLNGFSLETLGVVFGHEIILGTILGYLIFVIATVGFTNAMNLIDGLDGLSSIVSIIIFGAFAWMGFKLDDPFLFWTSALAISSIFGFLALNWHPAKIFMGDSGSLTIGFLIVILAAYAISIGRMTPASVLLIAAIPILDTLIVMIRRIAKGLSPFSADKTHIHHLLLRQQRSDIKRTVLLLGAIQLLFTYIGLGFKVRDDIIILGMFFLLFFVFYFLLTPKTKR